MLGIRVSIRGPTHVRKLCSTPICSAKAPNPYTSTILLPKTNFPLRADAAKREHLFRDRCTKDLYPWQVCRSLGYIDLDRRINSEPLLVEKQSKGFIHPS